MNADYVRTVQLLLAVAPAVFDTPAFAMKGGTALNLFVQDMPRLSVDIDVVFVPHGLPRPEALDAISAELAAAQARIEALGFPAVLRRSKDGTEAKLFVSDGVAEVKVEVNFVFRGTVLQPERRALTPAAQQMFSANVEVPVLSTPELYAGKLVAALDRQHPRDLFDVQLMLASGGWSEDLLDCFVVYLAGHNRPAHEVLFPNEKPLDVVFESEFVGMTSAPVQLGELVTTRQRLLHELPRATGSAPPVPVVGGARRAGVAAAASCTHRRTAGVAVEAPKPDEAEEERRQVQVPARRARCPSGASAVGRRRRHQHRDLNGDHES